MLHQTFFKLYNVFKVYPCYIMNKQKMFFVSEQCYTIRTYHILFIHSPISNCLDCFGFLTIMNNDSDFFWSIYILLFKENLHQPNQFLIVVLIYISLIINDIEQLFMYLLAICVFWIKQLLKNFAHFKIDLIVELR